MPCLAVLFQPGVCVSLSGVLDEIDLRAQVELAKLEVSGLA